jgi:hypothetical protein
MFPCDLSSNPTLDFVAAPALAPAEVAVDANLMAVYEAELKRVGIFHLDISRCKLTQIPTGRGSPSSR